MFKENVKMQPKCIECGIELKLYEIDYEKKRRIMQCPQCGLYHFYKRDFSATGNSQKLDAAQTFGEKHNV